MINTPFSEKLELLCVSYIQRSLTKVSMQRKAALGREVLWMWRLHLENTARGEIELFIPVRTMSPIEFI